MTQGAFVWYELATTDPQAAAAFYGKVMDWEAEPVPQMDYTLLKQGEARVAGISGLPGHVLAQGIPPHWVGYIHVDDVDATIERAQARGATLRYGPEDIPGFGRFAKLTDPDHAPFSICTASGPAEAEAPAMASGHPAWHELKSGPDDQAAFDFYADLFGWTRGEALNMGPMGTYQMFDYGGRSRGGFMKSFNGAKPGWTYYVAVPALDAAERRVVEAGGTVTHGPQEVPGGAWVLNGCDPQGAGFALVSAQR